MPAGTPAGIQSRSTSTNLERRYGFLMYSGDPMNTTCAAPPGARFYNVGNMLTRSSMDALVSGEGYETPGIPPVASAPVTSRVEGNPPL
eukprot:3830723-Pyramimonas_sp.AAC.1